MVKSKKGIELAFNLLITIIIGIVILAFLIFMLTNTSSKFKEAILGWIGNSNVDNVISTCNYQLQSEQTYEYCCSNKTIILERKKFQMNCLDVSNQSWGSKVNKGVCEGIC